MGGTPKWLAHTRNPIKMDDWGGTPILGNLHVLPCIYAKDWGWFKIALPTSYRTFHEPVYRVDQMIQMGKWTVW